MNAISGLFKGCYLENISLFTNIYWMNKKKFAYLASYGIKSMWLIFQTEMLIYQSKAKLDEKILLGKIETSLRPNNWKNACKGVCTRIEKSMFQSGP